MLNYLCVLFIIENLYTVSAQMTLLPVLYQKHN